MNQALGVGGRFARALHKPLRARRSRLLLIPLLLANMACTTPQQAGVVDAATTPLADLNLLHADIPPVLVDAQKAPYALPPQRSCAALAQMILALDDVLGADLDVPPTPANPGLLERGSGAAGTAAVGALKRTAEGVVPFRGWVRKLSGAERYSKQVAAAIAAGGVRRGFLKGLRLAQACA